MRQARVFIMPQNKFATSVGRFSMLDRICRINRTNPLCARKSDLKTLRQARGFYISASYLSANVRFYRHKIKPPNESEGLFCARREVVLIAPRTSALNVRFCRHKNKNPRMNRRFYFAPGANRTRDQSVKSRVLYP